MATTQPPSYSPPASLKQDDVDPQYTPSRPPSYRTIASTTEPTIPKTTLTQTPRNPTARPNAPTLSTARGIQSIASQFNIYAESGFTGRKSVTFTLPDKRTPAYFVDYRSNLADLVTHRGGSSGPVVGKATFHRFSGYIELHFANGQKSEMSRDGTFTRRHIVQLPAGPDRQYFWKGTSDYGASSLTGGNLKLEGASGTVFAAFARSRGYSKDGQLNILVEGLDQSFVDQIVVSFMALAEKERRKRKHAAAAAGGGGA